MTALLAFFLAQVGLPFSMLAGGAAAPTATPTPTGTATPTPGTVVATPSISPDPGTGAETPLTVTITCATSGATIFYTLSSGGTNPSHSGDTPLGSTLKYLGPFNTGSGNKVVRALGYKAGMTDSAIAAATYPRAGGGGQ